MLKIPEYKFKDGNSEWVHLMVEIGYWAYLNAHNNEAGKNTYITLLLPTRQCCSQFILFGSVLASFKKHSKNLTWTEFLDLEEGTEVFCQELSGDVRKFNAFVGNSSFHGDQEIKAIIRPRQSQRKPKEKINLFEDYYHERQISLIKPPTRGYAGTLALTLNYYRELLKDPDLSLDETTCDNLLVTNKTQWIDRSTNILSQNGHKISDLFFLTSETNEQFQKVILKSEEAYNSRIQRGELKNNESKVAILDGRKAVLEHYRFLEKQKNIIFLLEYSEYDESCESMIKKLMEDECRDSGLSLSLEHFRADMNIQLMAFNYKEQDA